MAVTAKRNTKDTVFRDFFSQPKNLLALYKVLHPEDTQVTEDMLGNITIENVLTDQMYNDLGFTVGDRLMILIEAQSTWSVNIIVRAFLYMAESYQERFKQQGANLYSSKKVSLPGAGAVCDLYRRQAGQAQRADLVKRVLRRAENLH